MGYPLLPSLKANFTAIPQVFMESIFEDPSVSRSELITSLFCFNESFRWHGGQMVIHFQLVSEKTGLTESEAEAGLAEAHKRNTLILLPGDQTTESKKLYMLNLPDNKQFVETYYTNNASESNASDNNASEKNDTKVSNNSSPENSAEVISINKTDKPESSEKLTQDMVAEPVVPNNVEHVAPNNVEHVIPDDVEPVSEIFDYDDDDAMIPFEDEVAVFEEEVVGYEDGALAFEDATPGFEDKSMTAETASANSVADVTNSPTESAGTASPKPMEPRSIEFDRNEDGESSGYLPTGMSLPFHKKTVEMIGKMLGRSLSKAETEKLFDLGANDQNLIEAMSSLLSKTTKVYSSDLIVYEYEQIESNNRTSSRYQEAKVNRQEQIERQSNCMKCGGLGYIFQGLNNIHECDCKK